MYITIFPLLQGKEGGRKDDKPLFAAFPALLVVHSGE